MAARPGAALKLAANLPYNIATPIIGNLLECPTPPATMTITIQKELAERITAEPGTKDYGALTVWIQSQCRTQLVRLLPPSVFWPRPKVTSAIVHIELDDHPTGGDRRSAVLPPIHPRPVRSSAQIPAQRADRRPQRDAWQSGSRRGAGRARAVARTSSRTTRRGDDHPARPDSPPPSAFGRRRIVATSSCSARFRATARARPAPRRLPLAKRLLMRGDEHAAQVGDERTGPDELVENRRSPIASRR